MATNINVREERRKRILERGSDRMALITGRVQSLPPSPRYPSSPLSSRSTSSSAPYHQSLLSDQHQQPHNTISAAVEKIKENDHVGDKILPDHKSREEIIKEEQHSENGSHTKKPQLRKLNNISTTTTEAKLPLPEQSSSMVQKANTQKEPVHFEPIKINRLNNLFTSKELNSCIVASGNIRIFCAFIIAILVVISYVDYPLFGINLVRSQSVVASRPLYLLLLTDVTIVAAHLLYLKKLSGFEQSEEEKQVPQADEEADNWEGAFKVLERGLVVYQAIRGIFMDCSVYTVVVVCGLSLV